MRMSRKEEKKKKTREGLHKCFASHRIKKRNKTREGLHKCFASHRINNGARISKSSIDKNIREDFMFLRLTTSTHGNVQPHETCCNSIADSHLMNDELYS
jgi:hypothetical protein